MQKLVACMYNIQTENNEQEKGAVCLKSTAELANSIKTKVHKNRVTVLEKDATLTFIGAGRSAVVFKVSSENKALKVFFPDCIHIAKEEAAIYNVLKGNNYFPQIHESGDNFLLIDYIEGDTLFECLTKGIKITEPFISEIDQALLSAKQEGLNPSDIHLRNIILTTRGDIKLIDLARFRQTKNCRQWKDLKKAFTRLYKKTYFPKKIPGFILNAISYLYKKRFPQIGFVLEFF